MQLFFSIDAAIGKIDMATLTEPQSLDCDFRGLALSKKYAGQEHKTR